MHAISFYFKFYSLASEATCFKKKFFLNYSWHTILYYFQVYHIVIRHSYTLWSDYPYKFSTHLTLDIVITIFWLYSLCCTLYPHDSFHNWQFVFLIPSSCSPIFPSPLPSGNYQFSVFMSCFYLVSLFCFLDSTYKENNMSLVFHYLTYFIR